VASVDTIHKPGSTSERREDGKKVSPLKSFKFQDGRLLYNSPFTVTPIESEAGGQESGIGGRLTNLLYNLENLRKRDGENQEE